jgi:hypothetical protein
MSTVVLYKDKPTSRKDLKKILVDASHIKRKPYLKKTLLCKGKRKVQRKVERKPNFPK